MDPTVEVEKGTGFGSPLDVPKPPAPTKPAGSDGVTAPGGFLFQGEKKPSLIGTQKWITYDDITLNTAVVASAMRVWTDIGGTAKWSVTPNKRGGKDAERAADIVREGLIEAQMSKPWRSCVRKQIVKKFRGFAMHEVIIRKRSDGMIVVGDLQHRPQWSIYRWLKMNIPAGLKEEQVAWDAVEQLTRIGNRYTIPRERIFYSVEDALGDAPDGVGLLRHLAELSRIRNIYALLEGVGFQTNLNGMPIGRAPLQKLAQQAIADGVDKDDANGILNYITSAVKFMRDLLEGHNKTPDQNILLDSKTYTTLDAAQTPSSVYQWSFDVVKAAVAGQQEVASAIQRIDREMARVMCAEWLLLGAEGSGGAYSMHSDKTAMFGLVVNACINDIADDATRDIAARLVALNGLDPETCTPTLVPEPVSKETIETACKALLMIAQSGLHPDDEAPDVIRDRLDLPAAPKIPAQDWLLPRGATIAPPGTQDVPGKIPIVGVPPAAPGAPQPKPGAVPAKDPMAGGDGKAGNPNANTAENGGKNPMTLATVTVGGGSPIEVYDTLTNIDAYLNAGIGDGPTAWRALMESDTTNGNNDGRSRVAVAVTRFFDDLSWQGTANNAGGTTLAWPRDNVVIGGVTIDATTIPGDIIRGFYEGCGLAAADDSFLTAVDSGSNLKSMGAGPARLEFFRPTSAIDGNATVLPVSLNRRIGPYMAAANPAAAAASAGFSSGTSDCSDFQQINVDGREWPL